MIEPKKYFNEVMTIGNIAKAYRLHEFPNAYCLMTTSLEDYNAIATENVELVESENRKVVLKNGSTRFIVH